MCFGQILAAGVVTLAAASQTFAFGSDDEWASGWGQGIAEAIIRKGPGNQIYVTCDQGAGQDATKISFTLMGQQPSGGTILLTFDGEDPKEYSIWDGGIPSNCRACASNYQAVIDKMKRHSTVHVRFENGLSARFTLKGSKEAIGECTPDIFR